MASPFRTGQRPSRTAEYMALFRAVESAEPPRRRLFEDPYAAALLAGPLKALARFDRDVLSQPSVSHVVIMEGINDIGWPGTFLTPPEEPVTAEKIIAGYQQLIDRAHLHGIKVIGE